MVHIWHEDSNNSTTTQFWEFLKREKVSKLLYGAEIKGFNGNKNLADYVKNFKFNYSDKYYIFIDNVQDNKSALVYYRFIKDYTMGIPNVKVENILCFEYLMIKFRYFIEWTQPVKHTELYDLGIKAREEFIECAESNNKWFRYNNIVRLIIKLKYINTRVTGWERQIENLSSENVAALILSAMTNGGTTDFGITKTRFGKCWHCDCCNKYTDSKRGNEKCRMYKYKKKSSEKAHILWNNTYAKKCIEG